MSRYGDDITVAFEYGANIVLGQRGRVQITDEHTSPDRVWVGVVRDVADLAHGNRLRRNPDVYL